MKRLLIIGLDGATFDVLHPLIRSGLMPNLASVMERGSEQRLQSTVPPVTPTAWASFMTGKNPGQHGILDFRLFDRATRQDTFVNATFIDSPTIWEYLSSEGVRVGLLNLPMTFPPRPVNGFVVSGFDTPSLQAQFTYPESLRADILQRWPEYDFVPSWAVGAVQSQRKLSAFTAAVSAAFKVRTEVAEHLVSCYEPDVFMVHYQNLDVLQHKAWGYLTGELPASELSASRGEVLGCLSELDACIGKLLSLPHFGDSDVLIVSDHGFGPHKGYILPNVLLEHWGYLKRVPALEKDRRPQFLGRFREGLRQSRLSSLRRSYAQLGRLRWRIRRRLQPRPHWMERARRRDIASELRVDWAVSRAVVGMAEIYGFVQVLETGPGREAAVNDLIRRFQAVTHPNSGETLFEAVLRSETVLQGPHSGAADLVLIPSEGWTVIREVSGTGPVEDIPSKSLGTHRLMGILVAAGPSFQAASSPSGARLVDLAPTILHGFGLPVPDDMDGRVLAELFREQQPVATMLVGQPGQQEAEPLSADETASLEERLRALGYLA